MQKIIDNRVGEPDLSLIPPHLLPGKLPAELYLLSELGYSLDRRGMHRCLEAIAADFNRKNNSDITEANVVLAAGARSAATSAILRVLGKTRRLKTNIKPKVLLIQPGYNLYHTQFEGFGCDIDFVNLSKAQTDAGKIELITEKLDKNVLFLPLCNPNNPTGEIYSKNFLQALLELLNNFPNLHIINDSIYDRIIRRPDLPPANLFALANKVQRKRVFDVNGLSKFYAYPGIRAGWLISDAEEIHKLQEYKDAQLGPLNNEAQLTIIAALEMTEKLTPYFFDQVNKVYNERLEFVHKKLHQIKGFKSEIPPGSFYYWADFSNLNINVKKMVDELAAKNIYLAWGGKFGAPKCIRINCGAKAQNLNMICDGIIEFCRQEGLTIHPGKISLPSEGDLYQSYR